MSLNSYVSVEVNSQVSDGTDRYGRRIANSNMYGGDETLTLRRRAPDNLGVCRVEQKQVLHHSRRHVIDAKTVS